MIMPITSFFVPLSFFVILVASSMAIPRPDPAAVTKAPLPESTRVVGGAATKVGSPYQEMAPSKILKTEDNDEEEIFVTKRDGRREPLDGSKVSNTPILKVGVLNFAMHVR